MHIDCITTRANAASFAGSWLSLQRLCGRITALGHRIEVLACAAVADDALGQALVRRWRAAAPDAVHIELAGPAGMVARTVARELGLPVSASFHRLDLYVPSDGRARMRRLLADFHAGCDATVATCAAGRAALLAMGGPPAEVIPDGVDPDVFAPIRRDPALRSAWGAAGDAPVLLWAGRMVETKGLDLLAAAAAQVRDVLPQLVLIGDGPGRAALLRALPWAVAPGAVEPERMPQVLASADILLHTSPDEPWGNVLLEAAAAGLAVVARSGGALYEVLLPAGACVDPPPQDAAACAAALRLLAGDVGVRVRLGRAARAAAAGVSLARSAAAWLELWQRLGRRGPSA